MAWVACLKFVEKTLVGGYQPAKFVKVFSVKNFPLYGMVAVGVKLVTEDDHKNY